MKPSTKRLLSLFRNHPAQALTFSEIRTALGAGKSQGSRIRELLRQLVEQGRLQAERNRYRLPAAGSSAPAGKRAPRPARSPAAISSRSRLEGIFRATTRGFGFVELQADCEDLFIPPKEIAGALDGDRVSVEPLPARRGRRGAYRVVEVHSRRRERVRGFVSTELDETWLSPLNDKLPMVFLAEGAPPEAHHRHKMVEVEIVAYPDRHDEAPEGKFARLLDDIGGPPAMMVEHIMADLGVSAGFSPACEAETARLQQAGVRFGSGRTDQRDRPFVTIDGEDARDFDDAICLETGPKGARRLSVAIADVAAYVLPKSPLDDEAYAKGTSVYLPDRVLPMLPAGLSNDLCSLKPDIPRLTLTCEMEFDRKGTRTGQRIFDSVIRSKARLTYGQVQRLFDGGDDRALPPGGAGMLTDMRKLAAQLRSMREKRGALDFSFGETRIELDKQGNPRALREVYPTEATRLIEQFMLEANETVAAHCAANRIAILYRNHEPPPGDQAESLIGTLWNLGFEVKKAQLETAAGIKSLLQSAASHPNREQVELAILRSLSQAVYRERNKGHFALSAEHYTHFTSPIRRYPDLLVHRALKASFSGKRKPFRLPDETGFVLSTQERTASEVESRVIRLYKTVYMEPHVGKTFPGTVTGTLSGSNGQSLRVRLRDEPIDGLVPSENLPGGRHRSSRPSRRTARGGRPEDILTGTKITVVLARADRLTQQLDFSFRHWGWDKGKHAPPP